MQNHTYYCVYRTWRPYIRWLTVTPWCHNLLVSFLFPLFLFFSLFLPATSPLPALCLCPESLGNYTERQVTTQTPESGQPELTLRSCTTSWLRELTQIWPLVSSSVKWGRYPLHSNDGIKHWRHSWAVKKHLIPGRYDYQFKSQWAEHLLSVDVTLSAVEAT